jgi:hypothetical protein
MSATPAPLFEWRANGAWVGQCASGQHAIHRSECLIEPVTLQLRTYVFTHHIVLCAHCQHDATFAGTTDWRVPPHPTSHGASVHTSPFARLLSTQFLH